MRKTSTTLWVLNLCQGYLDETNPSVWYDHVLSQPRSKKVLGSNHPLARMWSLYVLPASLPGFLSRSQRHAECECLFDVVCDELATCAGYKPPLLG